MRTPLRPWTSQNQISKFGSIRKHEFSFFMHRNRQNSSTHTAVRGITGPSLSSVLCLDSAAQYQLRVIALRIIYFQGEQQQFFFPPPSSPPHHHPPGWWQLYRGAGFLSNWCTFTFAQSAIPQVEGKSGQKKKKKKKRLHHPELLILNKTGDVLRKMQNNPPPPSHSSSLPLSLHLVFPDERLD